MKQITVSKSQLRGSIVVPPSKSHTLRAILFASMAHGVSKITRFLPSPDSERMITACRKGGAIIDVDGECLRIRGNGGDFSQLAGEVDCGNSGQVLRFFGALAALSSSTVTLTGDRSIQSRRPAQPLIDGINQLGGKATSLIKEGYAPIEIGRDDGEGIGPGECTVDGTDSQPISALLILASQLKGKTTICVKNPGEKPWIELTLYWLDKMGIQYEREGYEKYIVYGKKEIDSFEYSVPGDWSSAAYPICAALITRSHLTIEGLDRFDIQGDRSILQILSEMGAQFEWTEEQLHIYPSVLTGCRVDLQHCIDGITILAVMGCYVEGKTVLYNGEIARQKECDRIAAIATELRKMGAYIVENEDGLVIEKSNLHSAICDSYSDHRMVLSLAVAALNIEKPATITNIACVAKSYPTFTADFQKVGAKIQNNESALCNGVSF